MEAIVEAPLIRMGQREMETAGDASIRMGGHAGLANAESTG